MRLQEKYTYVNRGGNQFLDTNVGNFDLICWMQLKDHIALNVHFFVVRM